LKADESQAGPRWKDGEIVQALNTRLSTVHRVRQEFVESAWRRPCIARKSTGYRPRKLDGAQEARLIALACGPAPEGRARWTLKLLAQRMVELEVVPSLSAECVRTTLKKTNLSRG
jgi:transposase